MLRAAFWVLSKAQKWAIWEIVCGDVCGMSSSEYSLKAAGCILKVSNLAIDPFVTFLGWLDARRLFKNVVKVTGRSLSDDPRPFQKNGTGEGKW
jgi:hypothetical protein